MAYQHKTARRAKPKRNAGMLLTVDAVADELGIGVTKVFQMRRSGEIEAIKIGHHTRFPRANLEKFIERKLAEQQKGQCTA